MLLVSSRNEIVGRAEDRGGNLNLSKKLFAMGGTETRESRAITNTGYLCHERYLEGKSISFNYQK